MLASTIDLRGKKKAIVNELLTSKNYTVIDSDTDFKYLVKLPMDSVTEENISQLEKTYKDKGLELEEVKTTMIEQMWLKELSLLETEYLISKKKVETPKKKAVKSKSVATI